MELTDYLVITHEFSEADRSRRSRSLVRWLLFFWPIVDSPADVDRVTRVAYLICVLELVIDFATAVPDLLHLDPRAWIILAQLCVLTFLGANALRQKSVPAAVMLTVIAATHIPVAYLEGDRPFPYLPVVVFLAYLVAWRSVALAAAFPISPPEAMPPDPSAVVMPRQSAATGGFFLGRLPPRLWPRLQWLFWISATLQVIFWLGLTYVYIHYHLRS